MPTKNSHEYLADLDEIDQTMVRLMARAMSPFSGRYEPGDEVGHALLGLTVRVVRDLIRAEIARDVAAGGDGNLHNAIVRLAAEREAAAAQKGGSR